MGSAPTSPPRQEGVVAIGPIRHIRGGGAYPAPRLLRFFLPAQPINHSSSQALSLYGLILTAPLKMSASPAICTQSSSLEGRRVAVNPRDAMAGGAERLFTGRASALCARPAQSAAPQSRTEVLPMATACRRPTGPRPQTGARVSRPRYYRLPGIAGVGFEPTNLQVSQTFVGTFSKSSYEPDDHS